MKGVKNAFILVRLLLGENVGFKTVSKWRMEHASPANRTIT